MNPATTLDQTFAALADPTRRTILARLALGEATVNELARPFAISQPAISRHLKVLEAAGLIESGQDAQRRPRRLVARPLAEVIEWLEPYRKSWEESFVRLDSLLEEMKGGVGRGDEGSEPSLEMQALRSAQDDRKKSRSGRDASTKRSSRRKSAAKRGEGTPPP
jgi:DNA-binding transcriptional ArsR family regulator